MRQSTRWIVFTLQVLAALGRSLVAQDDNSQAQKPTWKASGTIDGYETPIHSLAFGPGTILVSGDEAGIRIWESETKQEFPFYQRQAPNRSTISGITFAPDNTWVSLRGLHEFHFAFGDKYMKDGRPLDFGVGGRGEKLWPLAIATDGKTYAMRLSEPAHAVHIVRHDFVSKPPMPQAIIASCKGHEDEPQCAAFSPDAKTLATGSRDRTVRLWDCENGKPLDILRGHALGVAVVSFAPNGELLATGGIDGQVKLWNVAARTERATLPGKSALRCLAFSPDGKRLACGDDEGILRIWSTSDSTLEAELSAHPGGMFAVAFNRDGKSLASGGSDKVLRLWNRPESR
ncbi:MAG: WD40 repeat domain-containing protein [Planctomycetales bacterium]